MHPASTSRAAATALLACLVLAGCVSSAGPGWTFAPPPAATAAPAASGAAGSPAPSGAGSASPSPAASGGTADVTISALNIGFEQSSVNAPAGKAFSLLFDNKDASVQHDVFIKDSSGTDAFEGAIVTGPTQVTYSVPSLAAGSYTFFCSIHSNMTGTLVVQ
jgi:plastocyanin